MFRSFGTASLSQGSMATCHPGASKARQPKQRSPGRLLRDKSKILATSDRRTRKLLQNRLPTERQTPNTLKPSTKGRQATTGVYGTNSNTSLRTQTHNMQGEIGWRQTFRAAHSNSQKSVRMCVCMHVCMYVCMSGMQSTGCVRSPDLHAPKARKKASMSGSIIYPPGPPGSCVLQPGSSLYQLVTWQSEILRRLGTSVIPNITGHNCLDGQLSS